MNQSNFKKPGTCSPRPGLKSDLITIACKFNEIGHLKLFHLKQGVINTCNLNVHTN